MYIYMYMYVVTCMACAWGRGSAHSADLSGEKGSFFMIILSIVGVNRNALRLRLPRVVRNGSGERNEIPDISHYQDGTSLVYYHCNAQNHSISFWLNGNI